MKKPPILRQSRWTWQYWKLTLIPLAVGTVTFYAADALFELIRFEDFLRFYVVRPLLNFIGPG